MDSLGHDWRSLSGQIREPLKERDMVGFSVEKGWEGQGLEGQG